MAYPRKGYGSSRKQYAAEPSKFGGRLEAVRKIKNEKLTIKNAKTMNKQKLIELAVKVLVAALTAFLTAITTTSCLGRGPF